MYLPLIAAFLAYHWWYPLPVEVLPGYGPLGISILPEADIFPNWIIILEGILLLLMGFLINQLVFNHRLNREPNLFAGLFFILAVLALPIFTNKLPLYLSNFFLLFAVMEAFSIYKRPDAAGSIFNIGLFIGVAGLFYLPALIFLLFGFAALEVMRSPSWRERFVLLTGALTALFLTVTVYQYMGIREAFFEQLLSGFAFFDWQLPPSSTDWALIGLLCALLLLLLGSLGTYQSKRSIQSQKKISLLYYLMVCTGLAIVFTAGLDKPHLILMSIPVGIFLSLSFAEISRGLAEVLFVVILLGLCWLHFGMLVAG